MEEDKLNESLETLVRGATRKTAELKGHVETVKNYCQKFGLTRQHVFVIADIVASGKYGYEVSKVLIKYLIPRHNVSEETILNILSKVLSNRCSNNIKKSLILWIVLIFDAVDSTNFIHCVYAQLYNLLRYETLASCTCQLISILTQPQDVTPFRVNQLIQIQQEMGRQRCFTMLFSVFKKINPSLVTMSLYYRQKDLSVVSNKREQEWKALLLKFICPDQSYGKSFLKATPIIANREIGVVNSKTNLCTFSSLEDIIRHIGDLKNLDETCQSEVYLTTEFLMNLLAISTNLSLQIRLTLWLRQELSVKTLLCANEHNKWLLGTLAKLMALTNDYQSTTRDFLCQYLTFWNGRVDTRHVSLLVSKLPLMDYEQLESSILLVFEKLALTSPSALYSCTILKLLHSLVFNYITVEIPQYLKLPENERYNLDWEETLENLIQFCKDFMGRCVHSHWTSVGVLLEVLQFYNSITRALDEEGIQMVIVPPSLIVYKSLFSFNGTSINLICKLIKNIIFKYMNLIKEEQLQESDKHLGQDLNNYITDIFNTLWRHKCFDLLQSSWTVYQELNGEALQDHYNLEFPISTSFSLEHHPAFLVPNLFYTFEMELNEADAFKGEFVSDDKYFNHLKANGCEDVVDLITSLRKGSNEVSSSSSNLSNKSGSSTASHESSELFLPI